MAYITKNKITIRDFYCSQVVYCTELASNWDKGLKKKLELSTDIISNRVWFTVCNGGETIGIFGNIQTALNVYNEL